MFHPIRRLYDWVLSLAHHRHAPLALFLLAFAESSFFPIPPDVLLIALALGVPTRAFRLALITTIGSVLGGLAGYAIGYGFMASAGLNCASFSGLLSPSRSSPKRSTSSKSMMPSLSLSAATLVSSMRAIPVAGPPAGPTQ